MPIFEYRCDRCGTGFEELVFSSTRVACPSCHTAKVTKKISVPARTTAGASAAPTSCDAGMPPQSCCGGGACHQN